MRPPQPRLLALAASLVLLGGVAAATTVEPDADDSPSARAPHHAEVDRSEPERPDGGRADDPASSRPGAVPDSGRDADAGEVGDGDGEGASSPGTGSTTDETLRRMLDRDLDDAVRTYQELGARDPR